MFIFLAWQYWQIMNANSKPYLLRNSTVNEYLSDKYISSYNLEIF